MVDLARKRPWALFAGVLGTAMIGGTAGLDTMWQDCLDGECYKVLGPLSSFADLQQTCHDYGGVLFSVSNYSTLQHVQSLFEREAANVDDAVLLLGAKIDHSTVAGIAFDDASAQTNASFIFEVLAAAPASLTDGECLQSARTDSRSAEVLWSEVACDQAKAYSVCKHGAPSDGFCYEIRWRDDRDRVRKRVLEPVTKFPLQHPKVADGICGNAANGYIPASGLWSIHGATKPGAASCKSVSGGELFYGYNYPVKGSSNTGFSEDNALAMFFVVDTDYRGYWVLAIDKPDGVDADNGYLDMTISGTGLAGANVEVKLHDDPALVQSVQECHEDAFNNDNFGRDCYAWNGTHGSFSWRWHPCCTDGMVLGRLPSYDFCIDVKTGERQGLRKMLVGNFLPEKVDIEMSEIPFDSGVNVCGYECPDFCSAITNCGECSSTKGCGWCPGYGCEPIGAKGGCAEGWRDVDSEECCEECAAALSCDDCVGLEGCGWNRRHRVCKSGSKYSRDLCQTSDLLEEYFAFAADECMTSAPTALETRQTVDTPAPTAMLSTVFPTGTMAPTSQAPTTSPTAVSIRSEQTAAPLGISDPISNATGPETADDGNSAESGLAMWVIIVAALGACALLAALLVGAGRYRSSRKKRRGRDGPVSKSDAEFASIAPGTIAGARQQGKVVAFQQGNPMFDKLGAIRDKAVACYPDNALVRALSAHKEADDCFRVYTNNPGVAMLLSEETSCLVRCTEDDGVLLDRLEKPGALRAILSLARSQDTGGKLSPSAKVKTHLRVKKRDEWTRHTDPASDKEYYYNGKLNAVVYDANGIPEARASTKREEADPLRWEFAPNEFEDFDGVIDVFSRANWQLREDLHLSYFIHPDTGERVWIESTS